MASGDVRHQPVRGFVRVPGMGARHGRNNVHRCSVPLPEAQLQRCAGAGKRLFVRSQKRCSSDCDCYRASSAALEIWVDRRKPNEIYNYEYSCWASTDETAIIPMPPCTYTDDVTAEFAGYTRVTPTCDASHPIVADCLMLAAASTGVLVLAIVVAPCLLLLASYCYIKTHRKLAEEMEEEMVAAEKGKRKKRDKVTREYKSKSKAEGKYDDVRDMYADTGGMF